MKATALLLTAALAAAPAVSLAQTVADILTPAMKARVASGEVAVIDFLYFCGLNTMTMQECREYEKTAIDAQNLAFANSGVRAVARSVGVVEDRAPLTVNGSGSGARLNGLPDTSVDGGETDGWILAANGADVGVQISDLPGGTLGTARMELYPSSLNKGSVDLDSGFAGGSAWFMQAFAGVRGEYHEYCAGRTAAHEFGHLAGLAHPDGANLLWDNARGWSGPGSTALSSMTQNDLMAGGCGDTSVGWSYLHAYSSPKLTCGGAPCGDEATSNGAKHMDDARFFLAGRRRPAAAQVYSRKAPGSYDEVTIYNLRINGSPNYVTVKLALVPGTAVYKMSGHFVHDDFIAPEHPDAARLTSTLDLDSGVLFVPSVSLIDRPLTWITTGTSKTSSYTLTDRGLATGGVELRLLEPAELAEYGVVDSSGGTAVYVAVR